MICYQLFEGQSPFSGIDAITAARSAAMQRARPNMQPLPPGNPIREVSLASSLFLQMCLRLTLMGCKLWFACQAFQLGSISLGASLINASSHVSARTPLV
jgi:hypothetical protein